MLGKPCQVSAALSWPLMHAFHCITKSQTCYCQCYFSLLPYWTRNNHESLCTGTAIQETGSVATAGVDADIDPVNFAGYGAPVRHA